MLDDYEILDAVNELSGDSVLKYVLDMIPYSVMWQDREGVFRGANTAFAKLCNCESTLDVVGKTVFDLNIPREMANRLYEHNESIMKTGKADLNHEETLHRVGGGIYVSLTSKIPMRDRLGNVSGIIVVVRDVTEAKKKELELASAKRIAEESLAELEKAHEELRLNQISLIQTAKMASLGVMASGLAHEINNPLAIIKGSTEALELAFMLGEPPREQIANTCEVVTKTVDRIAKIVKGLGIFARDSSRDELEETDVQEMINETLDFCAAKFRNQGVQVAVEIEPDLSSVKLNSIQVSQVLLNLLGNAFDAITGQSDRWIRIEAKSKASGIEISVTNSGPKILKEIASRIFEPFYTTKEVGKGTGLGLSISQGIIENHLGKIFVDHDADHTKIAFWLPNPL